MVTITMIVVVTISTKNVNNNIKNNKDDINTNISRCDMSDELCNHPPAGSLGSQLLGPSTGVRVLDDTKLPCTFINIILTSSTIILFSTDCFCISRLTAPEPQEPPTAAGSSLPQIAPVSTGVLSEGNDVRTG